VSLAGLNVGFFGLGEAGSLISADLASAGATVVGYDPAPVDTPENVRRASDPRDAVEGADLVMGATAAADAMHALTQALEEIPAGAVYADLATASAQRKRDLAEVAAGDGGMIAPSGGPGEGVGEEPGTGATRKRLRRVVLKGLAALLIGSLRAADAAGLAAETWQNVLGQLETLDAGFLRRLLEGTDAHSERRLAEMEAAVELLESLGIAPTMTGATVESLRRMPAEGLPEIPPP